MRYISDLMLWVAKSVRISSSPRFRYGSAALLLWLPFSVVATPRVILILDDMGYRLSDKAALALPKEVTFAILPDTPLSLELAEHAHGQGRDIMLHMPMEANNGKSLGPRGLKTDMYPAAISSHFYEALRSVPYAIGVNNHMGSRLTQEAIPMQALMTAIKQKNMFFIDSRTTALSVAEHIARQQGVPSARRHVFIDHELNVEFMEKQLSKLVMIAKQKGTAIGIAHPHPMTIKFLLNALPQLSEQDVELSPVHAFFTPPSKLLASENKNGINLTAPK